MIATRAANMAGIMMAVYIAMVITDVIISAHVIYVVMTGRSAGMVIMIATRATMMGCVMMTLCIANMIAAADRPAIRSQP